METITATGKAPGQPGVKPTWTAGAKSGVGCAMAGGSRLWFTLGKGIVNEIYHPRIDHPAIRDFGFFVSGPDGYFADESNDALSSVACLHNGVPAYRVQTACPHGRWKLAKEIIVDPERDVLLVRVKFEPNPNERKLRLFTIVSPRLNNQGHDNTGWQGAHRGWPMLLAQHQRHCLALASSAKWLHRSVGYVGVSDPWQDVRQHGQMAWEYQRAEHGHIALGGEIDLHHCGGHFVLALSLEYTIDAAALNAQCSLTESFDRLRDRYVRTWEQWQKSVLSLDEVEAAALANSPAAGRNLPDRSRPRVLEDGSGPSASMYRTSAMTLRVHRAKRFAGAGIASLAIPWGDARGDNAEGYHMTWVRDMAEEALGFLAIGETKEAADALTYLSATQEENGGWPQNMWLDGRQFWPGVQLDESALPLVLLDRAERESAITPEQVKTFWPMARKAAAFIAARGPATGQDRWENESGLTPWTLATEIAALLIAARMAERYGEKELAEYFRQTADLWNDCIEEWTYVTDTELSRRVGVPGYYVRIASPPGLASSPDKEAAKMVSPDALGLVRFGLRAPDDPRIVNTLKVIDAITQAAIPGGGYWLRYNDDHYGERADGTPPPKENHQGCHGRAWPLMTGERGHYELAAGHTEQAARMVAALNACGSQIGLLPEQVWDQPNIPLRDLYRGRPTGSAMPLGWAQAEYVRLLRSIRDKKIFDRPEDTHRRYVESRTESDLAFWRFDHQTTVFGAGRKVRIETSSPAVVRFTLDGWQNAQEISTHKNAIGMHAAYLPTAALASGQTLQFTFRWPESGRWEGQNFEMTAGPGRSAAQAAAKRTAPSKAMVHA